MPLVHHPVELTRPEEELDAELGTECQCDPPERSNGNVLDPTTLNERDNVLAESCLCPDIGLAPPEPVPQDPEASTKTHVVHWRIVTGAAHRRLT